MKVLFQTIALYGCLFFMANSCTKGGSDSNPDAIPGNLKISEIIATDGSGNVEFTATADNATRYFFEFGNGANTTNTTGITAYTYLEEGTKDYTVTVTATSATGQSIKKSIQITVTKILTLFWSEEFNIDGAPDPSVWGYDLGGGGWGNNESQTYTNRSENVKVQGGSLKIKAIKENYFGSEYTSARILTKNKFAFTYGKVEVRAKFPEGGGTWPAIWMLGSNIATVPWPGCGEIDIAEHLGSQLNKIYGTLHYPERYGSNANGSSTIINNATTEFHTYTVDWNNLAIKIYVDNFLYHTVANSTAIPFNHDFFFILNIAMGGGFGGAIDPAFTDGTLEVDYIRIYK